MYGVRGERRKYARDLQGFADRVLARRQARGSIYVFGELSRKVLKVVVEPNQKVRKKYYHEVVSIGVVNAYNMKDKNYIKIK